MCACVVLVSQFSVKQADDRYDEHGNHENCKCKEITIHTQTRKMKAINNNNNNISKTIQDTSSLLNVANNGMQMGMLKRGEKKKSIHRSKR